ncbi:winged helix-turn-helix domain-containing protein [Phytohabitans sp. LJ34]|uniref:winged helix-turn-helix domain-containing protein n=1 Tax=Phytohabitans sp. LJ34 TaxID=3452217 RepID=UPI003F89DED3
MPAAEAVYQTIIDDIRRDIASGTLKPGDKLPSINELRTKYECSAEPVKTALRMLSAAGDTIGHQGRGTFVARPTQATRDRAPSAPPPA